MDRNKIRIAPINGIIDVALRKESVDRNSIQYLSSSFSCVALRKESVDRNRYWVLSDNKTPPVALRKESVDRNYMGVTVLGIQHVALRKESVDRNCKINTRGCEKMKSLSARRAWIEISGGAFARRLALSSLSARRAWIEIMSDKL